MMASLSPLQRRLRENRYCEAAEACARVLAGLGVPVERRRVVDPYEIDTIWRHYLERLRVGGDKRQRWSVDQFANVQKYMDEVRTATSGMTVLWLALVNSEPVGIEVPADHLLDAALGYLVSPAGDLMLATSDVGDGLCVERNHLAEGDEYEIVRWGVFDC